MGCDQVYAVCITIGRWYSGILRMARSQNVDYRDIGAFLEDRARRLGGNAPIFYSDLAAQFGLPPVTKAWSTHPLCAMFGQLDEDDARLGGPLRTALVISKERNMPGDGFFKTFYRLRSLPRAPRTAPDKMRLYLNELDGLLSYYGHAP